MTVEAGKIVSITYKLMDEKGETLEEVGEGEEFSYLHGHGNIIPGLEEGLEGLQEGESFDVTVPPERAYGEFSDELVGEINLDVFPDGRPPEAGQVFEASPKEGEGVMMLRVVEVDEEAGEVVVDGNHPLAGQALVYQGAVAEVREATEQELEERRPIFEEE